MLEQFFFLLFLVFLLVCFSNIFHFPFGSGFCPLILELFCLLQPVPRPGLNYSALHFFFLLFFQLTIGNFLDKMSRSINDFKKYFLIYKAYPNKVSCILHTSIGEHSVGGCNLVDQQVQLSAASNSHVI